MVRRWTTGPVITLQGRIKRMREEHDQIIDASRQLSRRGFAMWGAAGLLAAGVSSLTLHRSPPMKPSQGMIAAGMAPMTGRTTTGGAGGGDAGTTASTGLVRHWGWRSARLHW